MQSTLYTVTDIIIIPSYTHTQLSKYAMTAAHEVSAARELIGVAEKRQQLTSRLSRRLRYIRFNMLFRIEKCTKYRMELIIFIVVFL